MLVFVFVFVRCFTSFLLSNLFLYVICARFDDSSASLLLFYLSSTRLGSIFSAFVYLYIYMLVYLCAFSLSFFFFFFHQPVGNFIRVRN